MYDARQFNIEIIALDNGSPALNSTAILIVNVTDENDNAPLFNKSEFSITLMEGAKIDEVFAVVSAVDADDDINSKVISFCF